MGIRTATATLAVVAATSAQAFQEPAPETVRVTSRGVVVATPADHAPAA